MASAGDADDVIDVFRDHVTAATDAGFTQWRIR
jgi:hypothetical protein